MSDISQHRLVAYLEESHPKEKKILHLLKVAPKKRRHMAFLRELLVLGMATEAMQTPLKSQQAEESEARNE